MPGPVVTQMPTPPRAPDFGGFPTSYGEFRVPETNAEADKGKDNEKTGGDKPEEKNAK